MRVVRIAGLMTIAVAVAMSIQPVSAIATPGSAIIDAAACSQNQIPRNDDLSSEEVALPFAMNFYGQSYNSLWVNNNGNVTFNGPLATYTPFGLIAAATPIIAPFFADVDTRGPGSDIVSYGWGETTYAGRPAFCVNWIDVGYYSSGTDKLNSFQLLLVDRSNISAGAFDAIFNYDKIQWESGSARGGSAGLGGTPARAGFASGSSTAGASLELLGSGVPGAFLDTSTQGLIYHHENSSVDGRYIYEVRNGNIVSADTYVALGDSFQSGEGDYGYYEAGTDQSGNYCHRSPRAYPHLLVNSGVVNLNLDFTACSGALIDDLRQTTVSGNEAPFDEGAQLDALGNDTRLVTIGIGGNDAGFKQVVEDCIYKGFTTILPFSTPCADNLNDDVEASLASLDHGVINTKLRELYREVRQRAPFARVVVVSYPRFFERGGIGIPFTCSFVRIGDQQWMNSLVTSADGSIGIAAVTSGFDYVNMADAFDGREMCSTNPAIRPLAFFSPSQGIPTPESFHPNADGHVIMADEITQLLGDIVEPTFVIAPQARLTRSIAVSNQDLHVSVAWPGSDIVTTLVSPSGVSYTRASPNSAGHAHGPTYEYWDLTDAENGEWTIEIYGADVDPGGEPVQFSAYAAPIPNKAPAASFASSGSGTDFVFDATASADPDGSIVEYWWEFGDGSTATGAIVDHAFPAGQEYRVMLRVTDNKGASDFVSSDRLIGSAGQYFASSIGLTNNVTVRGPLHVTGNFSCNSNGRVLGDVVVSGDVSLTNSCRIEGSVYAGGKLSMDSTPVITGDVLTTGDARFQSTARIGGILRLGGAFTSIDAKSIDYLTSNGIVGDVFENYRLPKEDLRAVPAALASGSDYPDFQAETWNQWMNQTAKANAAPSWSKGLTANPGCVMAPWSESVNKPTVQVTGDTLIDAIPSPCSTVSMQGMTVKLAGDLTIFANGFSSTNGLRFESSDGQPHIVNVVVPGARTCANVNGVSLSATVSDQLTTVNVDSAGKFTINGPSGISGKVAAGCLAGSGTVAIG